MIKNLILFCIFLLLISGCSKSYFGPDEKDDVAEKQLLSLNVTGFSQELVPFVDRVQAGNLNASLFSPLSSSGIDLRDYINTLEFKVYHKKNLIDSYRQFSDDTDFGKYEVYLPPSSGDPYNVYVTGVMLEEDGDIEMNNGNVVKDANLRILPEPTDAFFFFGSYTVDTEYQTENIRLKRFVGRLEIDLIEEIPSNASTIEITVHNTAQYFKPFSEEGHNEITDPVLDYTVKTISIKSEDIGRTDYSTSVYFVLKSKLGSEAELTKVTIRAINNAGHEISVREINGVALQANTRTKLTGRLFTHHANRDYEIELDSDWDSEVPEFRF